MFVQSLDESTSQEIHYEVVVVTADPDLEAPVGAKFRPDRSEILIGRSGTADIRFDVRTVSHHHVSLTVRADAFVLENLAKNGSTRLDGQILDPGRRVEVTVPEAMLQIGGVLLGIRRISDTPPYLENLLETRPHPLFRVRGGPNRADIGLLVSTGSRREPAEYRSLTVRPIASRALALLAENAGRVVSLADLEGLNGASKGGMHVNQMMFDARTAITNALKDDQALAERVRERVDAHDGRESAPLATEDDLGPLVKRLLRNQQGAGYRLCLRPVDVILD